MSEQTRKSSRNTLKTVVFICLAGIMGAGMVGLYVAERKPADNTGPSTRLPLQSEKAYARALDQYLCPCGACDLVLAECTCGTAVNVKQDTRQRLAQEDSVEYRDVAWILENIQKARLAVLGTDRVR